MWYIFCFVGILDYCIDAGSSIKGNVVAQLVWAGKCFSMWSEQEGKILWYTYMPEILWYTVYLSKGRQIMILRATVHVGGFCTLPKLKAHDWSSNKRGFKGTVSRDFFYLVFNKSNISLQAADSHSKRSSQKAANLLRYSLLRIAEDTAEFWLRGTNGTAKSNSFVSLSPLSQIRIWISQHI